MAEEALQWGSADEDVLNEGRDGSGRWGVDIDGEGKKTILK